MTPLRTSSRADGGAIAPPPAMPRHPMNKTTQADWLAFLERMMK